MQNVYSTCILVRTRIEEQCIKQQNVCKRREIISMFLEIEHLSVFVGFVWKSNFLELDDTPYVSAGGGVEVRR
jgi:hypothetical protein